MTDGRNMPLVYQCARAWDKLDKFRKERDRNKRYMYGDQWGDLIEYCGRMIPEEEYIRMQGNIPMTNNLIRRLARTVIGVYRNQNKTPVCVARDRDEQTLGETMSTMLEYNNKINDIKELNARMFEEFLISGLSIQKETYAQRENRRECWTDNVNPNLFFVDGPMNDPRHTDIEMIGEIHDVTFGQLASVFAKDDRDYERLQDIYKNARDKDYIAKFNDTFKGNNYDLNGFMAPQDPRLCRVIELWTLERRKAFWCHDWLKGLNIKEENLRLRDHEPEELSFYSKATTDFEYLFPFGWGELWGVADRTNYDLTQHQEHSGQDLTYFDQEKNEHYIPYVVEPSLGADRMTLALLVEAYDEEVVDAEKNDVRTVMRFHPAIAPFKCAVLPLSKKLSEKAREIQAELSKDWMVDFDDTGSIGKRYRRQDEIGTPFCITVDHQTLEDRTVTVRHRDSMEQQRVAIADLPAMIGEEVSLRKLFAKLD